MRRFAVLLVLSLLVGIGGGNPLPLRADTVPYHRFTALDGLPSDRITALEQSPNGMLWIGTDTGLAMYDGHEFRQISLPDFIGTLYVSALQAMPDGSIWASASRGEVLQIRPSGVIRVVELDHQFVEEILARRDAVLFITSSTVWELSPEDEVATATSFQYEESRAEERRGDVTGADLGPQGGLWVVHARLGPGRVRPDGTISFAGTPPAPTGAQWATIRFAEDGTAVAIREDTLYRVNLVTGAIQSLVEDLRTPTYLTVLEQVAYATRNHNLLPYDVSSGQRRPPLGPSLGLPETTPAAVLQGQGGGLWIGTHDGLLHLRQPNARLMGDVAGEPVKDVMQFMANDEALWARTWGAGLIRLSPPRTRGQPDGVGQWREVTGLDGALHAVSIDTKTWYRWREGTGWRRVRPVEAATTELAESVGVVGPNGQGMFKYENGLFRHPPSPDADPVSLATWPDSLNDLHNVAPARNGDIVHRAGKYVYRQRPDGTVVDTIGTIPGNSERDDGELSGGPHSNMRQMMVDEEGRVWGAFAYDNGLLRIDPASDKQRIIMQDRRIWRVDAAGDSLVLASTRQWGLYLIDARTGTVRRHLTRADGLKSNTTMAAHLTDDTLYVGHTNGITHLPTDGLLNAPHLPETVLTGLEVKFEERPLTTDSLDALDGRDVGFSYTGVTLRYPERIHYEVRLMPRDTAWQATTRRFTRYTNLLPRTYRFEVRAQLENHPPGPVATHTLTLPPRFYQTWWFRVLVALGGLGLIGVAYRWQVYRLYRQQKALEGAVEERTRQLKYRTEELAAEKQKTEEQAEKLAELDTAKNRFFAHVSHEFRTPLSLILGPIRDALQRASDGAAALSENQLRRMVGSAKRLQRLIDQLLDLATLEAGTMELDRRPGDVAALVERSADAFRSKAEQNEIALRIVRPEDRIETRADPEKVETIVSNLVGNAVKFTPDGGAVTVRVKETESTGSVEAPGENEAAQGTVRITVEDTGPGMAPEVQETIFDRFEQSRQPSGSATWQHEGTGLGLALTSELVELHGGTIAVDSTPGEGSTFTVQLPVLPVAGGTGAQERRNEMRRHGHREDRDPARVDRIAEGTSYTEGEAQETGGVGTATVLIVEDNVEMRAYLREELGRRWTIREAADGEEGWEQVQDAPPDLVLSDVMMPVVDGFELCRRLKAEDDLRTIPVLLLTARAGEEATREGLSSGADDYVAKPFDISELKQRIENHLAARRHLQARYRDEVKIGPTVVEEETRSFVEELIGVIDEHMSNPDLTVGHLADEMALSRRQFSRRVKRATGEPPGTFLRSYRIEQAKTMLEHDPETIAEVAYAVGFTSPSSFSQTFRKHVGCTPSAYADEQHRSTPQDGTPDQ